MPRRAKGELFVARESFWSHEYGFIMKGERVRNGHDLLKCHAEFFKPADDGIMYDVEQATAAPGERRGEPR